MAYNFNDFLDDGKIRPLSSDISYSLTDLSRVNERFQYTDVATGNTTDYDPLTTPTEKSYRFDTGSLKAWSAVDTANITSAMAEWSTVIPVSFSLRKMWKFAACFLFVFCIESPSWSLSPGLDYYSAIEGKELAQAKTCGVRKELLEQKVQFFLLGVSKQTTDLEGQKKIIDAFYAAATNRHTFATPEECKKITLVIQRSVDLNQNLLKESTICKTNNNVHRGDK